MGPIAKKISMAWCVPAPIPIRRRKPARRSAGRPRGIRRKGAGVLARLRKKLIAEPQFIAADGRNVVLYVGRGKGMPSLPEGVFGPDRLLQVRSGKRRLRSGRDHRAAQRI